MRVPIYTTTIRLFDFQTYLGRTLRLKVHLRVSFSSINVATELRSHGAYRAIHYVGTVHMGLMELPVPVPKAYDIHEKKYIVTGTFCSLGCAKAYIFSCHTFDVAQVATIFSRMASEVYGETDVRMNPPFQSLKAFGGTMDINTFRNNAKGVFVHEAPFISNYMVIEERTSAPTSVSDNWKHTIRGLRRPLKPISIDQGESEKALYDDFVASKEGEVKEKDTTNSQGSSTGNLARFIQ